MPTQPSGSLGDDGRGTLKDGKNTGSALSKDSSVLKSHQLAHADYGKVTGGAANEPNK